MVQQSNQFLITSLHYVDNCTGNTPSVKQNVQTLPTKTAKSQNLTSSTAVPCDPFSWQADLTDPAAMAAPS